MIKFLKHSLILTILIVFVSCGKDNETNNNTNYSNALFLGKWCAYKTYTSNEGWVISSNLYTISFFDDGTFYDNVNGSGTYTTTNNCIITFINNVEYYHYNILKFEDNQMHIKMYQGSTQSEIEASSVEHMFSKYGMLNIRAIDEVSHEPLPGVQISIQNTNYPLLNGLHGITNENGICSIEYPCPAIVEINAQLYQQETIGTRLGSTTVRLRAGETIEVTVVVQAEIIH